MRLAAFLHVLALGAWLGCLLVEGVLEAMAWRDEAMLAAVSRLHRRIDLFVEIPAFTGVLASGLWLSWNVTWSTLLVVKVALACFAISVNVACVAPVLRRDKAAEARDVALMRREARWVHLAFAAGVPAGLGAAVLGVMRLL